MIGETSAKRRHSDRLADYFYVPQYKLKSQEQRSFPLCLETLRTLLLFGDRKLIIHLSRTISRALISSGFANMTRLDSHILPQLRIMHIHGSSAVWQSCLLTTNFESKVATEWFAQRLGQQAPKHRLKYTSMERTQGSGTDRSVVLRSNGRHSFGTPYFHHSLDRRHSVIQSFKLRYARSV